MFKKTEKWYVRLSKALLTVFSLPFLPCIWIYQWLSRQSSKGQVKVHAKKEQSSEQFSHFSTMKSFLRLLKKYHLVWHFSLIMVVSIGLEALSPLFIFTLYSQWDEAVVEKKLPVLAGLLTTMVVSQVVLQLMTSFVFVMWRLLLGQMAMKNRKESAEAILTPKGIDIYVGNNKGKGAAVENAPQTIMNECINFMVNFVPLYQDTIRTIAMVTAGFIRMMAAGLAVEAGSILLASLSIMKLSGLFSQGFDQANAKEFKDTSRALNLFVGLRTEKNLHTYPNAKVLVGERINEASENILKNQSSRYKSTAFISVISNSLQRLAGPLITTFVLARIYFPSVSTMTYATFGQLIQIATQLASSVVSWGGAAEWWSKMHISLKNVEGVQKHIIEPVQENAQKRTHRDGLYADGRLAIDKSGLAIDLAVKAHGSNTVFREYRQKSNLGYSSITAKRGDYTLLVGHNGAGKTTLLSCITQAIPLSSQDINQASYTVLQVGQQADIPAFIRGECADLAEKKRSLWAFICYHWPVQIAGVTKKQITKSESLPGKNGKVDKSEIEKDVFYYLRKLGFKPELDNLDEQVHAFLHKPSGQGLSGGEVKKLFTATFLAIAKHAQVDVLILDEITAGMDVGSLLAFQKMMEDFHKKKQRYNFV